MPANLLNDLTIKAAKASDKQFTLRDGNGLFVLVHPNGSKYFQLRTTLNGKSKIIRLGVYPNVSLAEARAKSIENIKLIENNKDPIIERKLLKAKAKENAESTFKEVAAIFLEIKEKTLAPNTFKKINQSFTGNVYAKIGNIPIGQIDNIMVRSVITPIQKRGATEMAEKTRGWIKQVFDFAIADRIISENPIPQKDVRLKKHVSERFPHFKSTIDAGKFLRNLGDFNGTFEAETCARLNLHLGCRPSEIRLAEWTEFDLVGSIWTVPIERMKGRRLMTKPHRVFLSTQVLKILNELRQYSGSSVYLFPTRITGQPLSEATIRKIFRTCFADYHVVPHGCRHFFSTHTNESKKFDKDIIEAALSHKDSTTRGIYNNAEYEEWRPKLMQWWSDELDNMQTGAKILPLKNLA